MMIRRFFLFFSLILAAIPMLAQDIDVADFYLDEKDLTANLQGTMVMDQNGEKCALIKVKTTETGFGFDVGSLGVTKTEQKIAEIWVYVPFGVKRMTLSHQQFGQVEYYFPARIEKAKTYIMKLTTAQVEHYDYDHTETMRLKVAPPHATVYVDGRKYKPNADGSVEIDEQAYGRHPVKVTAEHYYEQKAYVVVDATSKDKVETINLEPRFGWLKVKGNDGSFTLYVDGEPVQIGADGRVVLDAGSYDIRLVKDMYKPIEMSLQIKKQEEYELKPTFRADFANVELNVGNNAEIFIDGKSMGTGRWKGTLLSGTHEVECRLDKHHATIRTFIVKAGEDEKILLDTPAPITGTLSVVTNPAGANLMLDGTAWGKAPYAGDIIIGEHTINATAPNHGDVSQTVIIKEGETSNLELTLPNVVRFSFTSKPSGANVFLDGQRIGVTPFTKEINCGDYDVKVTKNQYKSFTKHDHLDGSNANYSVSLGRQYMQKNGFYVSPFVQPISSLAIGVAIGGYFSNINIEANYLMGLSKSETIYWNSLDDDRPLRGIYKATAMGGKLGYGVVVGTRLRITPQVGANVINIKSSAGASGSAPKFYAVAAVGGVKIDYAVVNHISLFAEPEYSMAVKKSRYYEMVAPLSSKIKAFVEGVNIRAGVCLFF